MRIKYPTEFQFKNLIIKNAEWMIARCIHKENTKSISINFFSRFFPKSFSKCSAVQLTVLAKISFPILYSRFNEVSTPSATLIYERINRIEWYARFPKRDVEFSWHKRRFEYIHLPLKPMKTQSGRGYSAHQIAI